MGPPSYLIHSTVHSGILISRAVPLTPARVTRPLDLLWMCWRSVFLVSHRLREPLVEVRAAFFLNVTFFLQKSLLSELSNQAQPDLCSKRLLIASWTDPRANFWDRKASKVLLATVETTTTAAQLWTESLRALSNYAKRCAAGSQSYFICTL